MFENFAREVFCLVSDSGVGSLVPSPLPPGDERPWGGGCDHQYSVTHTLQVHAQLIKLYVSATCTIHQHYTSIVISEDEIAFHKKPYNPTYF